MIIYHNRTRSELTFEKLWTLAAALSASACACQFRQYPAVDPTGWQRYLKSSLQDFFSKESTRCYVSEGLMVVVDINPWDREVFGFPIATTRLVLDDRQPERDRRRLVSHIKSSLDAEGVRFVTARPSSEDLALINAFLGNGFTYIESILWPVLDTRRLPSYKVNPAARYYVTDDPADLPQIREIARTHNYEKGHFHCEPNFNPDSVNNLYVKWAETSFHSDDQVVVAREADTVVGYFVCGIDDSLTRSLGATYGRLKSLALKEDFRGKGYGMSLFYRTLEILKGRGADYIDSGYASKNHTSAYLHSVFGFHSVFEQVTLHAWLR